MSWAFDPEAAPPAPPAPAAPTAGFEMSIRIGQRMRHTDYAGRRVTGVVRGLSVDSDSTLQVHVLLDAPIIIPARDEDDREISIWHQHVPAHELTPFDDRDELIAELLQTLQVTRGNIASLGPAGAIPFECREWLAVVDAALAKAATPASQGVAAAA